MLSDQQNGTFRRAQRQGFGSSMLGPMLQQGLFSRTAPNVQRMNTSRGVNAQAYRGASPGSGFGSVGATLAPTGVGSPNPLAALMGPQEPPQQGMPGGMTPLLAQLGMLLMAQHQGGQR